MSDEVAVPRRNFLGATGMLAGLLAAGGSLSLIAPARAWALDLAGLTTSEGSAMLRVARTIAPHDSLEDAAYALVVKAIDEACAADATVMGMVRSGLQGLGMEFGTADEEARVAALKRIEQTDFFRFARGKTLGVLYASPLAYAHFGYEGEAFSKGGYLLRGFNDLRWLPEVPLVDSGPAPSSRS